MNTIAAHIQKWRRRLRELRVEPGSTSANSPHRTPLIVERLETRRMLSGSPWSEHHQDGRWDRGEGPDSQASLIFNIRMDANRFGPGKHARNESDQRSDNRRGQPTPEFVIVYFVHHASRLGNAGSRIGNHRIVETISLPMELSTSKTNVSDTRQVGSAEGESNPVSAPELVAPLFPASPIAAPEIQPIAARQSGLQVGETERSPTVRDGALRDWSDGAFLRGDTDLSSQKRLTQRFQHIFAGDWSWIDWRADEAISPEDSWEFALSSARLRVLGSWYDDGVEREASTDLVLELADDWLEFEQQDFSAARVSDQVDHESSHESEAKVRKEDTRQMDLIAILDLRGLDEIEAAEATRTAQSTNGRDAMTPFAKAWDFLEALATDQPLPAEGAVLRTHELRSGLQAFELAEH